MEMLQLLSGLSEHFSPILYVVAKTDTKSASKVLDFEKALSEKHRGKSKVISCSFTYFLTYDDQVFLSPITFSFFCTHL